jgi:hypothetical protein
LTEKKRHIANPIEHHGYKPTRNFAPLVNDLIRDGSISSDAFRVLSLLLSHDCGWQESANEIAKRFGWTWRRAKKAMDALVTARLLVIQHYLTADGNRAYEKYHVHWSRRFTDDEVAKLGGAVVLSARHNPICQNDTTPSAESTQPLLSKQQNTEKQEENKEESAVASGAVPDKTLEATKSDVEQQGWAPPLPGQKKMPGGGERVRSADNVTLVCGTPCDRCKKSCTSWDIAIPTGTGAMCQQCYYSPADA